MTNSKLSKIFLLISLVTLSTILVIIGKNADIFKQSLTIPNIENIETPLITLKTTYKNQNLTKVPESLIKDYSVTTIDLSDNQINSLPSQVENWKNLVSFNISNNKVNSLPGEIRHWQKLKVLNASGNGMTNVPAEIGRLDNLREIDFSNNLITEFPNEILKLTKLEVLNISNNPVKPEHLAQLKKYLVNTKIIY